MDEPFNRDESLFADFANRFLIHWSHAQIEEFKNNKECVIKQYNKSIKIGLIILDI